MVAGSHRGVFVTCFKASFNGKPKSQLAVWKVAEKTTPIMETKLASLTENCPSTLRCCAMIRAVMQ